MLYWNGFLWGLLKAWQIKQVAKGYIQWGSEYLHRWRIHNPSVQPAPVFDHSRSKKFSFSLIIFFSIPACAQCPYCTSPRRACSTLSVPRYEGVTGNSKVSMTCSSQGWIDSALTVPPCTPSAQVPSLAWRPQYVNVFFELECQKTGMKCSFASVEYKAIITGSDLLPTLLLPSTRLSLFAARAQCWFLLNFLPTGILKFFSTKQFYSPYSQMQNCTCLRKQIITQTHHRTGYFLAVRHRALNWKLHCHEQSS